MGWKLSGAGGMGPDSCALQWKNCVWILHLDSLLMLIPIVLAATQEYLLLLDVCFDLEA